MERWVVMLIKEHGARQVLYLALSHRWPPANQLIVLNYQPALSSVCVTPLKKVFVMWEEHLGLPEVTPALLHPECVCVCVCVYQESCIRSKTWLCPCSCYCRWDCITKVELRKSMEGKCGNKARSCF